MLFLIKNTDLFRNTINYALGTKEDGLIYNNIALGDLVNTDTDGDGILDWEEPLWGLDPSTKETTPGVPDSSTIAKLKSEYVKSEANGNISGGEENLTQTDMFSRELFSTVATLNQNGTIDEATAGQIGSSLAEHIKNPTIRKIYTTSDIKIVKNDSDQTIKNYANVLDSIFKKYTMNYSVLDILQKFIIDENNVDVTALKELDPIITRINDIISEMVKINVPESLVKLHLEFLNSLERIVENLSDIQLYENDSIIALSGINKYNENATKLSEAIVNLANVVTQKLKN